MALKHRVMALELAQMPEPTPGLRIIHADGYAEVVTPSKSGAWLVIKFPDSKGDLE